MPSLGPTPVQVLKFVLPTSDGIPRLFVKLADVDKVDNLLLKLKGTRVAKTAPVKKTVFEKKAKPKTKEGRRALKPKVVAKPKSSAATTLAKVKTADEDACMVQDYIDVLNYALDSIKDEQVEKEKEWVDSLLDHGIIFLLEGKISLDLPNMDWKLILPIESGGVIQVYSKMRKAATKAISVKFGQATLKEQIDEEEPVDKDDDNESSMMHLAASQVPKDASLENLNDAVEIIMAYPDTIADICTISKENRWQTISGASGGKQVSGAIMRRAHGSYQKASKAFWNTVYGQDIGASFLQSLNAAKNQDDALEKVMHAITSSVWESLQHRAFDIAEKIASAMADTQIAKNQAIQVLQTVQDLNPKFSGIATVWPTFADLEGFSLIRAAHTRAIIADATGILQDLMELHPDFDRKMVQGVIDILSKASNMQVAIQEISAVDLQSGASGKEMWTNDWIRMVKEFAAVDRKTFCKKSEAEWTRICNTHTAKFKRLSVVKLKEEATKHGVEVEAGGKDEIVTMIVKKVLDKQKDAELVAEEEWNDTVQNIFLQMHDSDGSPPAEADEIKKALTLGTPDVKLGAYAMQFPGSLFTMDGAHFSVILAAQIQTCLFMQAGVFTNGAHYNQLMVRGVKDPSNPDRTKLGNRLYASFADPGAENSMRLPLFGKISLVKCLTYRKLCVTAGTVVADGQFYMIVVTPTPANLMKENSQCVPAWLIRVVDDQGQEKKTENTENTETTETNEKSQRAPTPPTMIAKKMKVDIKKREARDTLIKAYNIGLKQSPKTIIQKREVDLKMPGDVMKFCRVESIDFFLTIMVPHEKAFNRNKVREAVEAVEQPVEAEAVKAEEDSQGGGGVEGGPHKAHKAPQAPQGSKASSKRVELVPGELPEKCKKEGIFGWAAFELTRHAFQEEIVDGKKPKTEEVKIAELMEKRKKQKLAHLVG